MAAALTHLRGKGNAQLRLSCLFHVSHFFHIAGVPRHSLDSAAAMLSLAELVENLPAKRQALLLLGAGLVEQGHVGRAVECYARALPIAKQIRDVAGESALWNNTAVALQVTSQFEEAIQCAQRALVVAAVEPSLRNLRAAAFSNIAYCCLRLGQLSAGIKAAESSLRETPRPESVGDLASLTTREQNFALLLIESGQMGQARQAVNRARECAARSGSPYADVSAQIVSGLCSVRFGDARNGIDELENAASRSKENVALNIDALTCLVKAYDMLGKPDKALVSLAGLSDLIRASRSSKLTLDNSMATLDLQLVNHLERATDRDLSELKHREALLRAKLAEKKVEVAALEMLERLAVTADLREEASGEHGYRVGKLSALLASELGCSWDSCQAIELTARLHDIGKIGVPDRILLNSQELKEAERHLMSAHTLIGVELLAKSNIPQLRMAEEIARSHHEWWNGSGYPSKLSGKRIPLHARIVALADVFDAITHGRPYEQAWPIDRALEQIRALRGEQFDPDLTDRFLAMIEKLRRDHADLDEYLGLAGRNSPFLQARRRIRKMLDSEEHSPPVAGSQTQH